MTRESTHVHFVDDRSGGWTVEWSVALPIVRARIDHHALHRRRGIIPVMASGLAAVAFRNSNAAPVWIKQDLGGIKSHPACWIERTLDAIAVKLPRFHIRHEYMPVMIGAVEGG